jgi:hypothetical protein
VGDVLCELLEGSGKTDWFSDTEVEGLVFEVGVAIGEGVLVGF